MLQIIFIWWIIGMILTCICSGKMIIDEVMRGEVDILATVIGTIMLSFIAPILIVYGIIVGVLNS